MRSLSSGRAEPDEREPIEADESPVRFYAFGVARIVFGSIVAVAGPVLLYATLRFAR